MNKIVSSGTSRVDDSRVMGYQGHCCIARYKYFLVKADVRECQMGLASIHECCLIWLPIHNPPKIRDRRGILQAET